MLRVTVAAVMLLSASAAWASDVPKPDLVLIPRDVATAALNWLAEPNAGIAVKLYAALQACIQDNPSNGTVTRGSGGDQCPVVMQAIEAREKEIADLQKQLADAKKDKAP